MQENGKSCQYDILSSLVGHSIFSDRCGAARFSTALSILCKIPTCFPDFPFNFSRSIVQLTGTLPRTLATLAKILGWIWVDMFRDLYLCSRKAREIGIARHWKCVMGRLVLGPIAKPTFSASRRWLLDVESLRTGALGRHHRPMFRGYIWNRAMKSRHVIEGELT